MARMIRKQVYIEPWQEEMLKRRSKELGVSEAELIRTAVTQALAGNMVWRKPDPRAWEEMHAFLQTLVAEASQDGPRDRPRDWTREDLYEERLSKLSGGH